MFRSNFFILFFLFCARANVFQTSLQFSHVRAINQKKMYCLLCSLIASYMTNLFCNYLHFIVTARLPLTRQNNLKISNLKFRDAHELHIKICFTNVIYSMVYNCSRVYRVSFFQRCRLIFHSIVDKQEFSIIETSLFNPMSLISYI